MTHAVASPDGIVLLRHFLMGVSMPWLQDLTDLSGQHALDVATGRGSLALELVGRFETVVGIDLPSVIDVMPPVPGVNLQGMDAERLEFDDASFDLVSISWSLHHLKNPGQVLMEMVRVLRPGGTLLVIEPIVRWGDPPQRLHLSAHLLLAQLDRLRGRYHAPIYTQEEVEGLIADLGLAAVRVQPLLELEEDRGLSLEALREAGAPWVSLLQKAADDPSLPESLRSEALGLADEIARVGLRTSPAARIWGRKSARERS